MKEGPDIALLGSLIGDPARANILTALMGGKALTATELAGEAGVTAATASAHLRKLEEAGLLRLRRQGRHRYFALADDEVGHVLEAMMGLAAGRGLMRTRTGPRDAALRKARICYNHLAGDLGVAVYDAMRGSGMLVEEGEDVILTPAGAARMGAFGVDTGALKRRPLCRACLDWSSRRTHLAGPVGAAILTRTIDLRWARRVKNSRAIAFTAQGEAALRAAFVTAG